ncbi:MAG TPA: HAD-IIA family hydrolase [Geminicoccaceae bacterium]|nr:HAD-IIA family hydrolase [Geminicoccaceae bacterium]
MATKAHLIDMDGVLVRGIEPVPGAAGFIGRLRAEGVPFLVFTNNSRFTPEEHAARLGAAGIPVGAEHVFTSALATARFLRQQKPDGSAFVIGETGLVEALRQVGYTLTDGGPAEYVVLGETVSYSFERITAGMRLIAAGSRFIATNPDPSGPGEGGTVPATGAVAALITAATGVRPYFVGKPNPFMMRAALDRLGVHAANAVMIGDRMDTDVVAGTESGLETILVLTGHTRREDVARFPYRPGRVLTSVAEIEL